MKDLDGIKLDNLWREREGLGPGSGDERKPAEPPRESENQSNDGLTAKSEPAMVDVGKKNETPRKSESGEAPKAPKKRNVSKPLLVALVVLVICGLATLVVLQYQENQRLRDPQQVAAEAEKANSDLLGKVSRLIQLPSSTPIIYAVSDKEADDSKQMATSLGVTLENEDKIIIYSEDKMFIVYRPNEDRVIKSGPIAITAADEGATTKEP
ncbi:MAG: hypothetical protein LBC95_01545 [Candidatus Nomurabacteria bacterium]|jgi:cytoskeletal protein RodZ|nr:hypothetical protein [Candidatus Nomurabacteria bacterium]